MQEITIHPHPQSGLYCLAEHYDVEAHGFVFTIAKGYQFDGASIPPVFWIAFYSPYDPKVIKAALVHDFLYDTHEVSRKEADQVFKSFLEEKGVPRPRAFLMWLAVRMFGWIGWRKPNPQDDSHRT